MANMDIAAVPRIDSIVLTGLDFSMKPEHARFEADKGFIRPFPEIKVMHTLKALAITIYNQEKMTPFYHGNVCEGRNSLAYFICAMHRQQAPQQKSHSRSDSYSSLNSNSSSGSCKSTGDKKNCELPKLVTTSMLPLGHWDSMYYALVAEVRLLHADLQKRFGFGCEMGTEPIHFRGVDGTTQEPFTPIDLAALLETAWYELMDNRLVAALDDAVRMRRMREDAAKRSAGLTKKTSVRDGMERPPVIYGLMDVNALSPERIQDLLWSRYSPEVDKACTENFEDESMLTAYRAEIHAKQMEESLAVSTPLPTAAAVCHCHQACVCRLKCDTDSDSCTCQNRVHVYNIVHEQEHKKAKVTTKYLKQNANESNQFLGAATNAIAQMHIAAVAQPSTTNVQACRTVHGVEKALEDQDMGRRRARTNTNNSELAYVPDRATYRGTKDAYPLGFYGRNSGQRYPNMRPQTPSADWKASSLSSSRSHAQMPHIQNVPARKAVPPPIVTQDPFAYSASHYGQAPFQAPMPPSSNPYNIGNFAQAGQVTYPAIPVSQSQSMFTQSFPGGSIGFPRKFYAGGENSHTSRMDVNHNNPADEYIGLLSRHPSTLDHPEPAMEPLPSSRRAKTASPSNMKAAISNNDLAALKSLNKPQPALPDPDFIAPRPALKQRYVSAGGTAKLHERPEITGPAFITSLMGQSPRGAITKEELDAKMSDTEWIRKNFGEAALGQSQRRSDDSKRSDKTSNGRRSDQSIEDTSGDQRDRTSSGAAKTVAKLKRVFSRKNDDGDHE